MQDFDTSLRAGAVGEHTIWNILQDRPSIRQVIDVRKDKRYQEEDVDFLIENYSRQFFKLEIKTDFQADRTGNIAYELTTSGNIGCFAKTQADVVAYFLPNAHRVYLINMNMMKSFIKASSFEVVRMGDNATGYLLPIRELKSYGVIFETIEEVA